MGVCNYNHDHHIPDLIYPPTSFPNEPSTIDFLEINFSQRLVVDITINRANNPPKVITISNGKYAIIKYVFNGVLYKVAGKIRDIQVKVTKDGNYDGTMPPYIKPSGKSIFILEIDCSDRCESRIYNISSCDIRDIDIFDPNEMHKHHHHNHDTDVTNPDDPNNTDNPDDLNTGTGDGSENIKDITVTPDIDLEDDNDFGTDDPSQGE